MTLGNQIKNALSGGQEEDPQNISSMFETLVGG